MVRYVFAAALTVACSPTQLRAPALGGDSGADGGPRRDARPAAKAGPDAPATAEADAEAAPDGGSPADRDTGEAGGSGLVPPPRGIRFASPGGETVFRTDMRGELYEDGCPTGEVLIGMYGNFSDRSWIGQMGGICGRPTVDCSGDRCEVRVGSRGELPLRGETSSRADWERVCPPDHMIVGFQGRAGSHIDELTLRCVALAIDFDGASYSLGFSSGTYLSTVGDGGGQVFPDTDCATKQTAVTARIYSGTYVNALSLGCRTPLLAWPD